MTVRHRISSSQSYLIIKFSLSKCVLCNCIRKSLYFCNKADNALRPWWIGYYKRQTQNSFGNQGNAFPVNRFREYPLTIRTQETKEARSTLFLQISIYCKVELSGFFILLLIISPFSFFFSKHSLLRQKILKKRTLSFLVSLLYR